MECGDSKLRANTRFCPGLRRIQTKGNQTLTYIQLTQRNRNRFSRTLTVGLEQKRHRSGQGSLDTRKHTRSGHCAS